MSSDFSDGVAYRFDGAGNAIALDWSEATGASGDGAFEWVHLNRESERAQHWLAEESGLDPVVVEALLDEETRPRSAAIGAGLLVILRGVNLNPGADPEDMVSLRMWVEPERVVTVRRRPLVAVRELRRAFESGRGPASAGDLLVEIAGRLVERMAGVIAELDEDVDAVEEALIESPGPTQRSELVRIRRQAIALRRYLAPQRDALARLNNERVAWFSDEQRLRLREVTDTTIRFVEDLEAARERTAVTQDELDNHLAEQLNRRMYALSIIAGIFLPLSFVTGLLGINVAGIPGGEAPGAFALVCAALAVLAVGQAVLFRRLGWL